MCIRMFTKYVIEGIAGFGISGAVIFLYKDVRLKASFIGKWTTCHRRYGSVLHADIVCVTYTYNILQQIGISRYFSRRREHISSRLNKITWIARGNQKLAGEEDIPHSHLVVQSKAAALWAHYTDCCVRSLGLKRKDYSISTPSITQEGPHISKMSTVGEYLKRLLRHH